MHRSVYHSPIGPLYLESSGAALTRAAFSGIPGQDRDPILEEARRQLDLYFAGSLRQFDLPLDPVGTPFQKAVWQALRAIPWGCTESYGGLASTLGKPGAARAVGGACNRNPIPVIIPCHRVLGSDGRLTGYAAGPEKKRFLLDLEGGLIPKPLSEQDKRQICAWDYGGAYAVYNLPPYETLLAAGRGFTDPRKAGNYLGFWAGETLVGYVNIQEREAEVFIGIGVRPDLCGAGYGRRILALTCGIARALYPDKPLGLQVRTWNTRAVNCYLRAGFQIVGEPFAQTTGAGAGTFYRMIRK